MPKTTDRRIMVALPLWERVSDMVLIAGLRSSTAAYCSSTGQIPERNYNVVAAVVNLPYFSSRIRMLRK